MRLLIHRHAVNQPEVNQIDRNLRIIDSLQRFPDLLLADLIVSRRGKGQQLGLKAECFGISTINPHHLPVIGNRIVATQRLGNGDKGILGDGQGGSVGNSAGRTVSPCHHHATFHQISSQQDKTVRRIAPHPEQRRINRR